MCEDIKEIITPSKQYKAVMKTGPDGVVRITIFRWNHEIVEGYGEVCDPFWEEVYGSGYSFADPENSDRLALEELKRISGELLTGALP